MFTSFVRFYQTGESVSGIEELIRFLVEAGAIIELIPAEDCILRDFVPVVP